MDIANRQNIHLRGRKIKYAPDLGQAPDIIDGLHSRNQTSFQSSCSWFMHCPPKQSKYQCGEWGERADLRLRKGQFQFVAYFGGVDEVPPRG